MTYLKWVRLNRGLTQKQVAGRVGISQSVYCDYERGWKKPGAKHHARLANALEVPVDELTRRIYKLNPEWVTPQPLCV